MCSHSADLGMVKDAKDTVVSKEVEALLALKAPTHEMHGSLTHEGTRTVKYRDDGLHSSSTTVDSGNGG